MQFVDLSSRPRIARLMDLTRSLRDCHTPFDALAMYCRFLAEAFPNHAQVILASRGLPRGQYRVWRLRTDDGVEHVPLTDPWDSLESLIYSGGCLGSVIQEPCPRLVHHLECGGDPHFDGLLSPYHSVMAVPLFNEGLPLNWSLMFSRHPEGITPQELEDSVTRATLIGSLLDSLHVGRQLDRANSQIDDELRRMARIQRALLPIPIPAISGLDIAASYETFTHVGGDIYDFVRIRGEQERWALFIGDASGHGPSAAVCAAMVQATFHACARHVEDPAELLTTINRHICHKRIEGSFVTAFMALYDAASRRLTYASAGHPPPFLRPAPGAAASCLEGDGGFPLGIESDAQYEPATVDLAPGHTLLLYTDGISEARRPDGEMFGSHGIEAALRDAPAGSQGTVDSLLKSVASHQRGCRPDDDQTIVAIQMQSGES